MELPIALANLLPVGVKGIFCAILLMGIFGGDATHLHSWGSIFIQDFLVPLRKEPFSPRLHLLALRCSIAGVALFAFVFGALFPQNQYIGMWWSVTQAVFIGGAGSAIIGGLYWKKGTAAGAWAAMLTGSLLSVGGIAAQTAYRIYGHDFPLNGAQVAFYSSVIAVAVYVVVSLLTGKEDFNMDRMLHRGEYGAFKPSNGGGARRFTWGSLIGFDEHFTLGDKWIAGSMFGWGALLFCTAIIGTVWNLIAPWPVTVWTTFWHVASIGIPVLFAIVTGVWFTWGGLRDMRALFVRLRREKVNVLDDGTVIDHQNLADFGEEANCSKQRAD
jgi:SSS family solute:Na+ symporter